MKIEMGAKTWRNPEAEKRWVAAKKIKDAEEAEKAMKEEEKKAVEAEQDKLHLEEIVKTGRSGAEETLQARLAELRADVAALEAKKNGTLKTAEELAELDLRERAARELEDRSKVLAAEAEARAVAMVKAKEDEIAKRQKELEEDQQRQAERRRREMLEYKASLNLSPAMRKYGERPHGFRPKPAAKQPNRGHPEGMGDPRIYEDPYFWELNPKEQAYVESLTADEQVAEGFGPYDEAEQEAFEEDPYAALPEDVDVPVNLHGKGRSRAGMPGTYPYRDPYAAAPKPHPDVLENFLCVTTESVTGYKVRRVLHEVTGTAIRETPRQSKGSGTINARLLQRILEADRHRARTDLITKAIRIGANAVVGLKFETTHISEAQVAVVAYGTAVVLERDYPAPPPPPPVSQPNDYWNIPPPTRDRAAYNYGGYGNPPAAQPVPPAPTAFDPFRGMDPRQVQEWRYTDPRGFNDYVRREEERYRRETTLANPPVPQAQAPFFAQPTPRDWGHPASRYEPIPQYKAPPAQKPPQEKWQDYARSFAKKKAADFQAARGAAGVEGGEGEQKVKENPGGAKKGGKDGGKKMGTPRAGTVGDDAVAEAQGLYCETSDFEKLQLWLTPSAKDGGQAKSTPKDQGASGSGAGKKNVSAPGPTVNDSTLLRGNIFSSGQEVKSPNPYATRQEPAQQHAAPGAYPDESLDDLAADFEAAGIDVNTHEGILRSKYGGEAPFDYGDYAQEQWEEPYDPYGQHQYHQQGEPKGHW
ncbi:hypothetical protein P7C70_g5331, partial [Phenoliferia sp. Uapishka_3]